MAGRWLGRLRSAAGGVSNSRPRCERGAGKIAAGRTFTLTPGGEVNLGVGTNGAARSTSTRRRPRAAVRPPNPRRMSPDATGISERWGKDVDDEYRWMHDTNSEEVLRHFEAENRHSAACLRPLHRRASELFRCMVNRQPEEEGGDRRSVPERLGRYLYYTRRDEDEGKGFPVYVRRPVGGTLDDEQVVFDLNDIEENGLRAGSRSGADASHGGSAWKLGEGGDPEQAPPTPALGSMKLSPDQRMLACTIDVDGSDRFVLAVFELLEEKASGRKGGGSSSSSSSSEPRQGPAVTVLREDAMWDDVVGVEWGSSWPPPGPRSGDGDGDGGNSGGGDLESRRYELYYTVPDHLRRPWQVRCVTLHRTTSAAGAAGRGGGSGGEALGGGGWRVDPASDGVVFEETNDAFFVDVGKTKDHAFVVINVHSKTTSEVYLLPTGAAGSPAKRDPAVQGATPSPGLEANSSENGAAASGSGGQPGAGLALLRRRQRGVEYYVDHSGDAFYLVTNSPPSNPAGARGQDGRGGAAAGAEEYRLVCVWQPPGRKGSAPSLEGIADAPWDTVPSGGSGGTIQEMDLFKDHCVLYESCPTSGCPRLRVIPLPAPTGSGSTPSPFVVSPPDVGGCVANGGGGGGGGDRTGAGGTGARGSGRGSGRYSGNDAGRRAVSDQAGAPAASSACTLRPGVNSWFEARTARFSLSSPTAPEDVYDLCLDSGKMELKRRTEVPGSPRFDGGDYSCYTTQVASRHGEMVPLTIVHRRGLKLDGSSRLLLHGYGSYGMSLPIDYQPSHACMLERGWVLAFAHVRGGGERGKAWHAAGRDLNKWNSFWDFQACAEHLVSEGFTSPSGMGAHVNSAGGLLAGVMANFRPGLFSAMVMKAPFLGVLSAMRDSSLPLTVHEFDEWGDPSSNAEAEAVIRSYCPYENVREHEYPALLVTASVNDNRVNVWDPAKWVSRVRAANTGNAPVLLRVSDSDGHHGPGNTVDGLKDAALEMAFLEKHLKVGKGL